MTLQHARKKIHWMTGKCETARHDLIAIMESVLRPPDQAVPFLVEERMRRNV